VANKQVEIIEGEVTEVYPPNKNNDTGKWRPANIYIATTEGTVRLGQFPKGDYESGVTFEPIQMPAWYEALDLDNLVGARVQIAAVYQKTYEGTRQYGSAATFKVLNGVAPKAQPKPTATTTTTASAPAGWGSIDERIAWNSAINNAVTAFPWISNMTEDGEAYYTPNWLGEVDALARDVYALIRRGPAPVEEALLEPEDEDPFPNAPEESLGVLSAEDDDAN
jgi:hypothetical protein